MQIRLIILLIILIPCQSGFTQLNESITKQTVHELWFNKQNDTIRNLHSTTEFDKLGRKIVEVFYENDNISYISYKFYDSMNRIVRDSTLLLNEHFDQDTSITFYIYDHLGRLISEKDKDGFKTRYKYLEQDSLVRTEIRSNGINAQYYYDSLGLVTKIIYTKNNKAYYWIDYDYNFKGQQIHYTTSSYSNWHNYNLYDGEGNLVEFLRFDNNGNLIQRIRYIYNDQNNLIRKEEFDEKNNQPNHVYEYQ